MTVFPRVAIWDGTPNADYLRALITSRGYLVAATAQRSDVLVVDPTAAISSDVDTALRGGTGLVVLLDPANDPISADVSALLAEAGIEPGVDAAAGPAVATTDETAEVTDLDLLARVNPAQLSVLGTIRTRPPAAALLRHAGPPVNGGRRGIPPRRRPGGRAGRPDRRERIRRTAVQRHHLRRRASAASPGRHPLRQHLRSGMAPVEGIRHRAAGPAGKDGSVPETADHWPRQT